jgi:hypothetical protein
MSPAYYERSGEDRYGANSIAGDLAEDAVARVCVEQFNRPVVRFGPARVDTGRAQQTTWHPLVRHAPDFLQFGRFIECQGTNGEYVIFKKDKLEALITWNALMPVWFGLYNSTSDEVIFADLACVLWAIHHPDTEPMTLDADTKLPKEAWKVPLDVLLVTRFHNAFEAERVTGGRRKRKTTDE